MSSVAVPSSAALTARERFSEATSAVWLYAAAESRRLNQFYLGVEHLFLGLLQHQPILIESALRRWHLSAQDLTRRTLDTIGAGPDPDWEKIRVTPRCRKVLEIADRLSHQARRQFITPAHLFAAILLEGESIPARLLRSAEVNLQQCLSGLDSGAGLRGTLEETGQISRAPRPTPHLDRVGRDLVSLAQQNAFDPLVGRDRELELVIEVLCRRSKNNPVLLGDAGVGKTAIVEGLAQRIARGHMPPALQGFRLVQVTASRLLAPGASQAENSVRQLVEEVVRAGNLILFVDEMHTLASGHGGDAAALLKLPLARGELRCIGATTIAEYRRFIEGEPALERRFQPVMVEEPDRALTLQILKGLRPRYEEHHGVTLGDEALAACVSLSSRYLKDRQQPDKAIDLMDQSAARVAIRASGTAVCRGGEQTESHCTVPYVVLPGDVASVVSDLAGVEARLPGAADPFRMQRLEEFLNARILGQEEAVAAVAHVVRVAKRDLDLRPSRPDGVLLLVGPAGVGKTALAYALCEFLHGQNEDALVRLDMSEYSEPHSLARLVGPPPGYVGYEEEGQLTGRVRTHPDCVLLLDEIERAHPSVRALFLQVFDEGRLTDSRGRCIHFDHCTIVMTACVPGASEGGVGFRRDENGSSSSRMSTAITELLGREFVSRVDRVVPMKPLSPAVVRAIACKLLRQLADRLRAEGKELVFDEATATLLAHREYHPRDGARHLARAIEDLVIEPVATLAYDPAWESSRGVALAAAGNRIHVQLMPCCD